MNRREMLSWMGAAGAGWMAAAAPRVMAQDAGAPADDFGGDSGVYNPLAAGYDANLGQYVLPPLRYDYGDLQPHIDAQTMRLHHGKHHAGYVRKLNAALADLQAAREAGDFAAVKSLSRAVSFNGGGHTLHTLFWNNLAPAGSGAGQGGGGGEPGGELAAELEKDFGSVQAFRDHFSAAAAGVEGSGWAILGRDAMSDRLIVIQGENQQKLTTWAVVPLLVLDVWEHAYYLQYQNRRKEYVQAFWEVVNWAEVARRAGLYA